MENYSPWTLLLNWSIIYSISYISTMTTAVLEDMALLKGQTLTHKCSIKLTRKFNIWYFYPVLSNVETIIYNEKGLHGKYFTRAQLDNSSLVLTIPAIQLDDAGIYGCKTLDNSTQIKETAQVIVIESNLQCHKDESLLTCEIKYRGNIGPFIEWISEGPNDLTAINSKLRNVSAANGNCHLTLVTDSVNSTLTCQLYFKDFPTHIQNIATNIPTYKDRCNSSACCSSSSGTTISVSTSPADDQVNEMPQTTTQAIIYSITIASGVIIIISIIYISKRIRSVLAIPISNVDGINQADVDSTAEMAVAHRSQRLGYEEMQDHESPLEGPYLILNPANSPTRPLPYVNVTLEESSSETLTSRNDRQHQYLNVVIENAECLVSDGVTAKTQSYVNVSLKRERDSQTVEL